jgi:hypothetical protein
VASGWTLSGLILTDIYPPVEAFRKYGDSKFPGYDPGGQNMTERLTNLAQTLMVLYDGEGKSGNRFVSPVLRNVSPKAWDFTLSLTLAHQGCTFQLNAVSISLRLKGN